MRRWRAAVVLSAGCGLAGCASLDRGPEASGESPGAGGTMAGKVVLRMDVDEGGRARDAAAVESTGKAHERTALDTAKQRRTELTTRDGSRTDDRAGMPAASPAALPNGRSSGLSATELAIFNSPGFERRFAESYLAETEIEPRVTNDEREDLQEAMEAIQEADLDEAARMLQRKTSPRANAVFDFMLGNVYFQQDRLDEAAEAYQKAVEKFGKFLRAHKNLGLIHVQQGDFREAIEPLTRVIELGAADGLTYGLLAYAYANEENHVAAESAYRMAILLDPDTADWKMGLARSFFKQQRFAEAASFLGGMIAENPNRADLWLLQANAYLGLEKPMQAAENYELVDEMGASTVDSLNMLGDIYVNEELFDVAVDAYVRALELSPDASLDRAIRSAKFLAQKGAYDETRDLVEEVQRLRGDQMSPEEEEDLYKLQARIAAAEGASEREAEILKKIVELDPLDGEALILLGRRAGRTGDVEQAIFYFERAASIPQFETEAKVRHAQLLVREGRYAEALPLLRRAQQLDPRDNIQDYLEQVERIAKQR